MDFANFFANPAVTGMIGIVSGALAQFLVARVNKAPDMQASLNAAVAGVIQHYEKALERSSSEIAQLRAQIENLRTTVEGQTETIEDLEGHIEELTQAMAKAGVVPPPRRKRGAAAPA